jgi:hypothetical protein
MTPETFNLSEKQKAGAGLFSNPTMIYEEADVKEFIRLLKEKIILEDIYLEKNIKEIINKIAGDELI